jgi:hypothetical protein
MSRHRAPPVLSDAARVEALPDIPREDDCGFFKGKGTKQSTGRVLAAEVPRQHIEEMRPGSASLFYIWPKLFFHIASIVQDCVASV